MLGRSLPAFDVVSAAAVTAYSIMLTQRFQNDALCSQSSSWSLWTVLYKTVGASDFWKMGADNSSFWLFRISFKLLAARLWRSDSASPHRALFPPNKISHCQIDSYVTSICKPSERSSMQKTSAFCGWLVSVVHALWISLSFLSLWCWYWITFSPIHQTPPTL